MSATAIPTTTKTVEEVNEWRLGIDVVIETLRKVSYPDRPWDVAIQRTVVLVVDEKQHPPLAEVHRNESNYVTVARGAPPQWLSAGTKGTPPQDAEDWQHDLFEEFMELVSRDSAEFKALLEQEYEEATAAREQERASTAEDMQRALENSPGFDRVSF